MYVKYFFLRRHNFPFICNVNKNISDLIKIKRFCEDILRIIHQLGVGECTLKGFMAHKLYMARKQLRQLQTQKELNELKSETNISVWIRFKPKLVFGWINFYFRFIFTFFKKEIERFLNDDEALVKTAKIILQNVSAAPANLFSNDHNG